MDRIHAYEQELVDHMMAQLLEIPDLTVYGPQHHRAGLAAFTVSGGVHANDIAAMLDQEGIAIRSGHHCTQPLHRHLGISGTARASVYFYNTLAEVDTFIIALKDVLHFFKNVMA